MDQEGNDGVYVPPESNTDVAGEAASVGQKRPPTPTPTPAPMGEGVGLDVAVDRPTKRLKNGEGEMKKVAEMVLLLSAMGQMRGGRAPTDAEVKLMAEARESLVEICQNFAPKELVPGHVIGKVIDDLGLNWKLKDQRLGFRGSRLSIKEKVALAKRKMEEPKKFTTPGAHASQTSNPSFAAMNESRVPTHTIRSLPPDKPIHAALPSGSTAVHPHFTHVSATPSVPATYLQASNVEVKGAAISMGPPVNQAGNTSASKTQFVKMEPQANAYVNHPLVNAPTWSIPPNSLSKMVTESKVPTHTPVKAEGIADSGAPRTARDQAFRPFITQTTSSIPSVHQPVQTVKYSNHDGIARIVQKLLQPKLPTYPTWIPPSREYMNKALSCQSCSLTINEVETVAICDACEKGFHLKCLESVSQKGIPRTTEWHCMKCTSLSNGKPFPPKYGRVMRSMTPPKGPASATPGGAQFSDNKLVNMVQRGNHDKMSSVLQSVTESGTTDCSNLQSASGAEISSERGTPRDSITSVGKDVHSAGTLPNISDSTKPLVPIHDSAKVTLSGDSTSKQIQVAGSPILDSILTSEPKLDPSGVASAHGLVKHESKSQNNMQDVAQKDPVYNAEGSSAICQAGTIVEESRETGRSSPSATVINVKPSAEGDVQTSLLLHDDKQSEGGATYAPDSKHDAKQSDQGVINPHCASGNNSNQSEQAVDHAPGSKHDVEQSEQAIPHATCASEHNVEQTEQVVACAPSASDHNAVQGISHAPFASEQYVEQNEQGVTCVPSVSDPNVKQSEQEVGCPPDSEHNVEQNQQGLVHASSASDHNVEQSEQVLACAPSASDHNVEQSEQVIACAPADAEHNVQQSEQDVACASSDPEPHVEQNEQGFADSISVSEHNVEQTEQGFVHAPAAAEHNVEQIEKDVACASSDPEPHVEQNEQGVAHAISVSEHNVEQSEQGFVHAPAASGHNVQQNEEDVACAPSGSEHYVEQNEQGFSDAPSASDQNVEQNELDVACAPCHSEHNIEQREQGVTHSPSHHNVEQSEEEVACPPWNSEHNAEQNPQGL
ncbi:PHD finger protein At3g20280 [Linum grandiflorum]